MTTKPILGRAIQKVFVAHTKAVEGQEYTVEAVISTGNQDRQGEIVTPDAMKAALPEFLKRGVLMSSHQYHGLLNQIGQVVDAKVEGENTIATIRYFANEGNLEADWAYKLAKMGQAAYSIGFIPLSWEDGEDDGRTYTEMELLEVSHVPIPANREALVAVQAKSMSPELRALLEEVLAQLPVAEKGTPPMATKEEEEARKPKEEEEEEEGGRMPPRIVKALREHVGIHKAAMEMHRKGFALHKEAARKLEDLMDSGEEEPDEDDKKPKPEEGKAVTGRSVSALLDEVMQGGN